MADAYCSDATAAAGLTRVDFLWQEEIRGWKQRKPFFSLLELLLKVKTNTLLDTYHLTCWHQPTEKWSIWPLWRLKNLRCVLAILHFLMQGFKGILTINSSWYLTRPPIRGAVCVCLSVCPVSQPCDAQTVLTAYRLSLPWPPTVLTSLLASPSFFLRLMAVDFGFTHIM